MSTHENHLGKKTAPLVQIKSRRTHQAETEERIEQYHKLRDAVAAKRGREYWRSLEELADTPEFNEYLQNEFPEQASEWNDPAGRRKFMKIMGASLALAGISTACAYQPRELIVPYVEQPEELVPGKALYFATVTPHGGIGLLAKSNAGRPTKIEGNPDHPASLGSTDVFAQASILQLYDPDRSTVVLERGATSTWQKYLGAVRTALEGERGNGGVGVRILTETVYSPTLARQMRALLAELPQARWIQYDPVGRANATIGSFQAFGQPLNTVYRFDTATRVLSLDSDFLAAQGGANLRYSRDYIFARTPREGQADINRLYAIESAPTQTGAKADHRIGIRPSEMEAMTRTLAAALGVGGAANGITYNTSPSNVRFMEAMARDLLANRGRSIVIAGDEQQPIIHALTHAMNAALGNVGQTVFYTEPVELNPTDQVAKLRTLVDDMNNGRVQMLFVVGGNPVYNAPADFRFAQAMERVPLRASLSLYVDETARLCHWHVPQTHYLEEWSDVRAFDGTVAIVQPLIEPLYQGRSAHEFVGVLGDQPDLNSYNIVRETYSRNPAQGSQTTGGATQQGATPQGGTQQGTAQQGTAQQTTTPQGAPAGEGVQSAGGDALNSSAVGSPLSGGQVSGSTTLFGGATPANALTGNFEQDWRYILHLGRVPNTGFQPRPAALAANFAQALAAPPATLSNPPEGVYEIVFRADPCIYDGRYANNGWLQELPKPITKLTWDNAALVNPRTAARMGFDRENDFNYKGGGRELPVIRINHNGFTVDAPVFLVPGQPDDTITLHLGYGRPAVGFVGESAGFNAYQIRTSNAMWNGLAQVERTGERRTLASTQLHFLTEGRDPVRVNTMRNFIADPEHAYQAHHPDPPRDMTMFPHYEYDYHKWGMTIDLNRCVGCNACVIACQSENNIPVVGKEQVIRSREMHWLRIDAYYQGSEDDIEAGDIGDLSNQQGPYFQPLMCVHCEVAPCEPVCPVNATVHDAEGLNVMVYNRCVGTRYCSNNCPYKVRRFNFLLYQDWETPQYKLMRNPEVTVRSRGVMEKCTYCVQRIWWAKIEASKEGRKVRDGEVITACAAACPTETIVFGDTNDPNSRVSQAKRSPRDFALLGELNTRPQTTYLGIVRNPNPEIEPPQASNAQHSVTPNTPSQEQNEGVSR